MLDGARALLPEDHQPPAVPDEEPAAIARVFLDGLHRPQSLPAAVVIRDAALGGRGQHTEGVSGGLRVVGRGHMVCRAHLCRISSGKRVLSSSSTRAGRARKYTAPPSVPRQATAQADVGRTTVTRVMPGEQLEEGERGPASAPCWVWRSSGETPNLPCPDAASPAPLAQKDWDRDGPSTNSDKSHLSPLGPAST